MILNALTASTGPLPFRPQAVARPAGAPVMAPLGDTAELTGLAEQREASAVIASMVKGDAHDVQENLPFLTRTLYQGLGLPTLRELKGYGLTIQLAPSIPTEGAPGWDLLGAYDPRQQTVHLSPNVLKTHGETRAAQIVLHETLHGVDDCRLHQGLEGGALQKQQALEAKATDNRVFYASERDAALKSLQSRFESRVEMAAVAVDMLSEIGDRDVAKTSDRSGRYAMRKLDDGRWELSHRYASAPGDGMMELRSKLHGMALSMTGVPGAGALARATAPLAEDHEEITLADGRSVEFTHTKHGVRMVVPDGFSYDDWSDIRFSSYAYKSGLAREYYAEGASQYLSDPQSRQHIERVDPGMAGWLVAQFPGRPAI